MQNFVGKTKCIVGYMKVADWCPGYLEHALCSSEIHLAAAKSLEIIGHVTNFCKRPILVNFVTAA